MENAAALAPAAEEVVTDAPEMSEDDMLAEAFDRIENEDTEEIVEDTGQEDDEPADEQEDQEIEQTVEVEVPTDLPGGLKAVWKDLPENARETILQSHRDLSAKYSQVNREIQGIGPIRDAVFRAAREIPGYADLKPEQIANDVYELAKVSAALKANPEQTLRNVARQYGVNLGGNANEQGHTQESARVIHGLQQQIQQLNDVVRQQLDPQRQQQNFSQWTQQQQVLGEVQQFSASQPHWAEVEQYLPTTIPVVQQKLGPQATPSEVLRQAYEMAIQTFVPNARAAQQEAGDEPAPQAPQRVKTAVKAKSVNVQSKPSGKPKPMTEDEALAAAWDKLNKE